MEEEPDQVLSVLNVLQEQHDLGMEVSEQYSDIENQLDLVNEALVQEKNHCKEAEKQARQLQKELDQSEAYIHTTHKNSSFSHTSATHSHSPSSR